MNVTTQTTQLPLATVVNPPTDNLRRENTLREVISQPAAASQSATDKGVASDREKAKSPAQQNEYIDFDNIRKQAEAKGISIAERSASEDNQQSQKEHETHAQEGNSQANDEEIDQESHEHKKAQESYADEQLLEQLKLRDLEVKKHELAHANTGGVHASQPSYQYTTGPDGNKYATAGEVSIDVSPVANDPQATIAKMQKVHAAALAPVNPSSQDIKVAAQATQLILQAQSELLAQSLDGDDSAENVANSANISTHTTPETLKISEASAFDTFIDNTIAAQANIAPERSIDIEKRAQRIESFYHDISQAYQANSNRHFNLTA